MNFQVLDHLGIKKALAWGNAMGGWIATRMALMEPDRVIEPTRPFRDSTNSGDYADSRSDPNGDVTGL